MSVDERILKLLNLARNNPNSYEANSALTKAEELMKKKRKYKEKYEISGEDIKYLPLFEQKNQKKLTSKSWSDFFQIRKDPMIHLQIIPDRTVTSGKAVESLLHTFHSMYESWVDRVWNNGYKLIYKTQDFASFRIVYQHNRIVFYIVVPSEFKQNVTNSIYKVWDNATVTEVDVDYLDKLNPDLAQSAYVELKDHFFKSTLVDRTRSEPIPSLMAASRNIIGDDIAILDITFIPVSDKNWQSRARVARNKFKLGKDPKTPPKNLMDVLGMVGDLLADSIEKAISFIDVMTDTKKKTEFDDAMVAYEGFELPPHFKHQQRMMVMQGRELKPSTEQKYTHSGFETVMRIVSQSEQKQRATKTLTAIGTAFKDLSEDNEFEIRRVDKSEKIIKQLQKDTLPLFRLNGNIINIPEGSQILQLPTAPLQEEYPQIESIKERQIAVDKAFIDPKGIPWGEVKYRDETIRVYKPMHDKDERVLPTVGIGGLGQGKTKGLISNFAIEAVKKGFGCMVIDPNKKEVREQVEIAIKAGYLNKEQVEFVDLGVTPFTLDWCEAMHDHKAKARLAGTAIDFFRIADDTTGQTERFLKAAIYAMRTGRISEIIDILTVEDELDAAIERLAEGLNKRTLQEFKSYQDGMRRKILSPIWNRLTTILSDGHLADCMESDNSLDMVEIMTKNKLIVVDVSTMDLDSIAIDVIVNLLSSKVDLAMRLRKKVKGEAAEIPFYICLDEPHQFLKSSTIWESAVVESRKWNVGYLWTFHYFDQLPDKLQKAIRAALPHYHIYPTSPESIRLLKDIIKPFTFEDAMNVKRWHCINIIRTGGENARPFIAKMLNPPEKRFKVK